MLQKGGDIYKVKSTLTYDKFDQVQRSYDVGLLETREPLEFSSRVRAIGLVPQGVEPLGGRSLFVSGWGKKGVSSEPVGTNENTYFFFVLKFILFEELLELTQIACHSLGGCRGSPVERESARVGADRCAARRVQAHVHRQEQACGLEHDLRGRETLEGAL